MFLKVYQDQPQLNVQKQEKIQESKPGKGPFKYYVIKEAGGCCQKIATFDDLQYCKSSKSWVGGPEKVKNTMT